MVWHFPEIVDELGLKCKGDHEHDVCLGGKDITQRAGRYTPEIARAIHKGFVKLLKRKEPSRIRVMLRHVSNRIKKGGGDTKDLRWNERQLQKQLKQWQSVYAVEQPVGEHSASSGERPANLEDSRDEPMVATSTDRAGLSGEGISFDVPSGRRLDESERQALRKLHCNLGHPSARDLERFMRLAGVKQNLLEAVGWMKCMSWPTMVKDLNLLELLVSHHIKFNLEMK